MSRCCQVKEPLRQREEAQGEPQIKNHFSSATWGMCLKYVRYGVLGCPFEATPKGCWYPTNDQPACLRQAVEGWEKQEELRHAQSFLGIWSVRSAPSAPAQSCFQKFRVRSKHHWWDLGLSKLPPNRLVSFCTERGRKLGCRVPAIEPWISGSKTKPKPSNSRFPF